MTIKVEVDQARDQVRIEGTIWPGDLIRALKRIPVSTTFRMRFQPVDEGAGAMAELVTDAPPPAPAPTRSPPPAPAPTPAPKPDEHE